MNKPISREVKRSNVTDTSATEDDIKIALDMEKNGTPIPDSLKSAVDEYKNKNNQQPPQKEEEKEEENEEESGTEHGTGAHQQKKDDQQPPKPKPNAEKKEEDEEDEEDLEDVDKEKKSEDEGKNNVVPKKPLDRPVRFVPIEKYQSKKDGWKKREQELITENTSIKTELENLKKAQEQGNQKKFDERVNELADKLGMDKDQVTSLVEFLKGEVKLPDDVLKKVQEAGKSEPPKPSKEEEEEKFWKEQNDKFDSDFESALKMKGADPEMVKYKDKIKKLAFAEGFEKMSIRELWTFEVKPKYVNKKPPADNPNGFTPSGVELDWEEVAKDPEKIKSLTIDQAAKFQDYMGNRPRTIRRPGNK